MFICPSTSLQLSGSLWSEYRHWLTCLSPHLCPVLALAVDPVTENVFFITREEEEDDGAQVITSDNNYLDPITDPD